MTDSNYGRVELDGETAALSFERMLSHVPDGSGKP